MCKANILRLSIVFFSGLILTNCQKISDEDIGSSESEKNSSSVSLSVHARSQGEADIEYPLFTYAFNEDGKLIAYQKNESEEDSIIFILGKGKYTIVTLAGCSKEYSIIENPSLNDRIIFKNESRNYANEPMMMGISEINVEKKDVNVTLPISYCVSSIAVSLHNIPFGTKKVRISVSPLYDAISYNGQYQNTNQGNELTMNCYLGVDEVWKVDPIYIFPGCDTNTTFRITLEDESSVKLYSYIYKGAPKASQPFILKGTLAGDVKVNGSVLSTGWEDAILIDFEFSSSSGQEGTDEEENDPPSDIPGAGDIWNGCIVADVNGSNLFLLSMEEWECTYEEAEDIVSQYSVNGITGWSLPSYEQATFLRKNYYGEKLAELNNKIEEAGGETIWDDDLRFLCYNKDNIISSFKFVLNSSIVKAKNPSTYYYLRAAKSYTIK